MKKQNEHKGALKYSFIIRLSCCCGHGGRGRGALGPLLQFCHCQGARLQPLQMTDLRTPGWHATNHLGGRDVEGEADGNRPRSQPPKNYSHLGTRKMYPASPDRSKIYHQLSKNRRSETIHEGFALIGKFLGLWPSEKDLVKWIQHWWKPKGHYDLQLGSKGFFTIILHNLEDINKSLKEGHTFTTRQAFSSVSGWKDSAPKRKTSHMPRSG
jgi:hypothetical protein